MIKIEIFIFLIVTLKNCDTIMKEYAEGSVVPLPQHIDHNNHAFSVDSIMFRLISSQTNDILDKAMSRFHKNTFHDRGIQPPNDLPQLESLAINVIDLNASLSLDVDESYKIYFEKNNAFLFSNTIWGALRGLETFSQMIHQRIKDDKYVIFPNNVVDFPSTKHRGILLDVSTGNINGNLLEKLIDSLSFLKFNFLTLELSNDENFSFGTTINPVLHEKRPKYGNIFSKETLYHLVSYAHDRGILLFPQFRLAEGSSTWGAVDKLTIECDSYIYENKIKLIDPSYKNGYDIVSKVLLEAGYIFKNSHLFLSSEKANYSCWSQNERIRKFSTEKGFGNNFMALESYYITRLTERLQNSYTNFVFSGKILNDLYPLKSGSTIIIKDEGKDIIKQIKQIISKGYNVIFLGCFNLTKRTPFENYDRFINCDVFQSMFTDEEWNHIGGAGFLESVNENNLFSRIFTGAFAVADTLWNYNNRNNIPLTEQRYYENDCRFIRRNIPSRNINPYRQCRKELLDNHIF